VSDFIRLELQFAEKQIPVFVQVADVATFMLVLTGDEQAPTS